MVEPLTKPFATGRDADVYALEDGTVLRRYRAGGDVAREADLMRYARQHGYPVPVVHAAEGPDLVLQRLDGPTMLASVASGNLSPAESGQLLAALHERLHRITMPTGRTLVHGDLHPDNVIMTPDGPMVIDWRNAGEGSAELDVAITAVIIAQAALDPALMTLVGAGLRHFLTAAPDPTPALDLAVEIRAADRNTTPAERARLGEVADLIKRAGKT